MGPSAILAPFAGTWSDRVERRRLLAIANLIQFVSSGALWMLAATGNLRPGPIVALLAVSGCGMGLQFTTQLALVPLLVPPSYLPVASRINSVTFPAARSFGPAVAGVVLARFGATWTFGINTVSFLVVIWGLAVISPRATPVVERVQSGWAQFRDGLRYISQQNLRLAIATGCTVSVFAQSLSMLTAGLVAEEYHGGPGLIGNLVALHGLGALVGSWFLITRSDAFGVARTVTSGMLVSAAGILAAVATTDSRVAYGAYFVQGIGHVTTGSSIVTAIQTKLHETYRGRVMGVHMLGLQAGLPIGAGIGGLLGDQIGLRPTYALYVGAIVVFVAVTQVRFDGLARFDDATAPELLVRSDG